MLKFLYKIIILLCIFSGSLYYFGRDIKEEVFDFDKTVEMSETTFPTITLRLGNDEINLLHGYSSNINANLLRESITPIDNEKSFLVVINQQKNDVKRLIYELRSVSDNKLLETDTINALEKEEDKKTAKIKFKTELTEGLEYTVKITLVTSESRKINYYTRIKPITSSYYKEKLDFVLDFHNSIMDKSKAEKIIAYLEPDSNMDNSSFAYVNIHSSFDLISWGNLRPQVIGQVIPTIKEINSDMSSIELKYMISTETESGLEYYYVKEYYRVRYTMSRMYLLNYERIMESAFDINLTSLTKSEFKIGITNQPDVELITSSDDNKLAFVRQRELWYYNLAENSATKVFSFRQSNTDYIRDTYQEHNVRILNMDDDGNIDFMVYGYMNRGVYEGKVGIALYKFYSAENRIEEIVYVPMNVPYQILKEELNEFSYVNQLGIFYFTLNHTIYSYNFITKGINIIASNVDSDNFVVSKEEHYIAWQNSNNIKESTSIIMLDLETGNERTIDAPENENINLLGKIDNNIIYGFVKRKDISLKEDGSILVPMYKIEIADAASKILKEYKKKNYYITEALVESNVITIDRVKKEKENGKTYFVSTEPDNILNNVTDTREAIEITNRVTERTLTEYYVSLPSGFTMETKPVVNDTINTIITEDTTLRLEDTGDGKEFSGQYTVYALGDISGIFSNAGEAISRANESIGSVLDQNQSVIWERSIRSTALELNNIAPIYESGTIDSVSACIQMLINYRNGFTNTASSNKMEGTAYEILRQTLGESAINLTGANLDSVLYYVTKKRPVIAMKDDNDAVLIIGYDAYNITVIDPELRRTMKIGLNDSTNMFKNAGNIFFSYLSGNE
jgi:uncharacterized protein YvpB